MRDSVAKWVDQFMLNKAFIDARAFAPVEQDIAHFAAEYPVEWRDDVARDEPPLNIHRVLITLRQVAHVPDRGEDVVLLAQIFPYSPRLRRRFNNK